MSIQALREHKNELSRQANQLLVDKGAQTWAKEDQTKFDGLMDETERLDKQIAAHQRMLDAKAQDSTIAKTEEGDPADPKVRAKKALEIYLRKKPGDMTAEEVTFVRNTMSTTTPSQGGYTVQTEVSRDMINALKDYSGMRRVADSLTTTNGAPLNYPSSDGTGEMGEIVDQNATAAALDASFGVVPLNTLKYGSKSIAIPIELLQDSQVDIVAMVQQRMRDRIGRIQNLKFTQGNGTTEPNGLVTAASVGKVGTTGQTTSIIYDDLVDLADSVDIAYLVKCGWMFPQTLRKTIRKIKDTAGRPVWTPNYDAGISDTQTDMLLGYTVNINNDMPTPAANAKSLSFGQHGKYMIRDAMDIMMFRFEDSAFMLKGQVGFVAWVRSGGNLLDTNAVKTYQHSAT